MRVKDVFTTGQIAKMCRVAPRTVSKWFDSGRLMGYRIPGSQDRRVPRDELIKFLQANKIPLGELEHFINKRVLLVGMTGLTLEAVGKHLTAVGLEPFPCSTPFDAGIEIMRHPRPYAIILDSTLARAEVERIVARIRNTQELEKFLVVAMVGEDMAMEQISGCDLTLAAPYDFSLLVAAVQETVQAA